MQIIDSYRDAYSVDFNVLNEGRFQVDSSLTKTKEGKQVEVERKSTEKEAEWLERKAYNQLIREDRKRSVENLKNKNKRLREERKNALKGQKAKERDERKALRSYKKFGDSTIRSLYTYPPKFTVKWEAVDELNEDLFLDVKYGSIQHSLPFVDFLEDFLFVGNQQNVEPSTGNVKDYIEGFLNKMGTSSFYAFKTNPINTALETVPVYTLVNSYNEIITAKIVTSPDGIAKNTRSENEKIKLLFDQRFYGNG